MDPRRKFGNEGERVAKEHLIRQGYRIILAPWRILPYGEIDIVAHDGREMVFIEVKTRTSNDFGYPEEAVTKDKRQKISRLIEIYLQSHRLANVPYRFDVIAIEYGEEPRITHIIGMGIDA